MWIADVSIRRPVFAVMMIGSLVVLGLLGFTNLGVDHLTTQYAYVWDVQRIFGDSGPIAANHVLTDCGSSGRVSS